MNKIYDKVKRGYKQVNEMTEFKPQIALVFRSWRLCGEDQD